VNVYEVCGRSVSAWLMSWYLQGVHVQKAEWQNASGVMDSLLGLAAHAGHTYQSK
jgi:hypothetical protein